MQAFIIDDEPHAIKNLQSLLEKYTPSVQVSGSAISLGKALPLLRESWPDLLFLDINLRGETGFDLLSSINKLHCQIVFVTAHEEYALRALKAGALDYLLKPVDVDELKNAVARAEEQLNSGPSAPDKWQERLQLSAHAFDGRAKLRSITVAGQQGFEIILLKDIVYIEADGNYSNVHLSGLQKIVATKQVGEFEGLLSGSGFCRVHRSAIINLEHLRSYDSREGHVAKMKDGSAVVISTRRLGDFMRAVDEYAKTV